jgi:hypothetical protein
MKRGNEIWRGKRHKLIYDPLVPDWAAIPTALLVGGWFLFLFIWKAMHQ